MHTRQTYRKRLWSIIGWMVLLASLLISPAAPLMTQPVAHAQLGTPAARSALPVSKPRPHIRTTGAVGVAATFRAPQSLAMVQAAAAQSPNDWSADFTEGYENGLGQDWQTLDQSDDGFDRTWGVDDYNPNSGSASLWVAAGGADALDPEFDYYPPNLDSWLSSNRFFDLSNAQAADVEFNMYVDTEAEFDWIFVGASTDGENFDGEYWTGSSGGWQYYDLDLSEYIGYPQVYLAWYFHSDEGNEDGDHEGVWLDDVTVWTYVDSGPPQGAESIQNGDFETGDLSGWTVPDGSTVAVSEQTNPVAGTYVAYFGGIANAEESFYQPIALPAGDVTGANLGFWVNLFGEETETDADFFCAGIYNADLSELLLDLGCIDGVEAVTNSFDPDAWWQVNLELTGEQWEAIQGQTVNVAFQMFTDDVLDTTVLIDDVTLEVITGGDQGDAFEPNDTLAQATSATLDTPMADLTIAPDQDFDVFSLTGNAGDTLVVNVDAAVNGSPLDAVAAVVDANGAELCANDDDDNSTDPYLACPLPSNGTYYVIVNSYDGSGDRSFVYTLTLGLTSGGAPPPPPPPPVTPDPPPPSDKRAWTAILYIDGDNNLCDSYPGLITRMENELGAKIGDGGFLHIAVLIDLDPRFCNGQGGTTRYLIQPNGNYTENVNRWDMGELNMGDPQTLVNFANFAMQNYPADHYYLAIDNHGGGVSGIAWDDTNNHDNITNDELFTALKEITQNGERKLDVFAYEACLMGMYENAYDVRQFTNYIFFFPTISFANNASYPSYLGDARFTATATGRTLGDVMFDVYFNAVTSPYVVSLVETAQITTLHTAVNNWATVLQNQVGGSASILNNARQATQKVEANGDNVISNEDPYLDLWDLADKLAAQGIAVNEANALKAAIEAAVVRTAIQPASAQTPWDYSNSHGLTIFWPLTPSGDYADYVGNRIYNSTRDGQWDEFLQAFFGTAGNSRLAMQTSFGAIDRLPATTAAPQNSVYLPLIQR